MAKLAPNNNYFLAKKKGTLQDKKIMKRKIQKGVQHTRFVNLRYIYKVLVIRNA